MHRTNLLPVRSVACSLLVCVPLAAQTPLSLPAHADAVDGHHSVDQPFGTPGFRTQILVDAAAIAPTGAVINSIAFRVDRPSAPLSAQQIPNVTVELSHTSMVYGAMSDTFATNVTSTPTVVFQGTVNLPASNPVYAGPQPWDIVITFPTPFTFTGALGNLLIDITGNNPGGAQPTRWLDAVQGGGSTSWLGTGGNGALDYLNHGVHAGNGTARMLAPGFTFEFTSSQIITNPPGFTLVGLAPQPAPIDLAPIGAPGNFLYVDPIVLAPHNWTQTLFGWFSTYSLPVPGVPALVGTTLYSQSSVLDPAANALGLVLSSAVETRIGDPNEQLPLQQVTANDPAAATGKFVDFSYSTTPDYGSTPVRFDGVYF